MSEKECEFRGACEEIWEKVECEEPIENCRARRFAMLVEKNLTQKFREKLDWEINCWRRNVARMGPNQKEFIRRLRDHLESLELSQSRHSKDETAPCGHEWDWETLSYCRIHNHPALACVEGCCFDLIARECSAPEDRCEMRCSFE